MAQPTLSSVHVDAALTDYSVRHMNDPSAFVSRRLFPARPVAKQSNVYHIYTQAFWFTSEAQKRAPGTESVGRGYELSTDNYFCDVWAVHHDVSEQVAANADDVLDPEEDAAALLINDLSIAEEREFAATAFATGVWGTDVTGGTDFTAWSDAASTPIEDIATGIRTVLSNTGETPNKLALGAQTWYDGLWNHPDIIARLPDNAPRIATEAFLANLLGLEEVVTAKAIRNTAAEGLTASYSFILGSNALLLRSVPNPGPRSATAGVTFTWTGLTGSMDGVRTKRMEMPWQDAFPRVETDIAFDHKVTGTALGYFFSSAV